MTTLLHRMRGGGALARVLAFAAAFLTVSVCLAGPATTTHHIRIDQFGYRTSDIKIAVISDPIIGWNADEAYLPNLRLDVRRWDDDTSVYSNWVDLWHNGDFHGESGDYPYQFDFSAVQDPGVYYIWDPANQMGSYVLLIIGRRSQ